MLFILLLINDFNLFRRNRKQDFVFSRTWRHDPDNSYCKTLANCLSNFNACIVTVLIYDTVIQPSNLGVLSLPKGTLLKYKLQTVN